MRGAASFPAITTLVVAIVSAGLALGIWGFAPDSFPRTHTTLFGLSFVSAILSIVTGRTLKLGTAWLVLIAIASPALVLVPIYRPPVWIFPLIVLVLAGFYINGIRERVPLYLSNRRTQTAVSALVHNNNATRFIDLGCGLGDIVCAISKNSEAPDVAGVETAPLSFIIAWIRALISTGGRATIEFKSIWSTDVSKADVVYAFLSPAPMARLFEKLKSEMKPGSIFISNSFAVPGSEPDEVISVDDARGTNLLIWRM